MIPALGWAATPALGWAAIPALGWAAIPALGWAAIPALGWAAIPALGWAATPALGWAAIPALGWAATPALGWAAIPALGWAAIPALGWAAIPALGWAATPALGWAVTPALGWAVTPALGWAVTPALGWAAIPRWGDSLLGLGADLRAWGANRRALGAPIASSDGQATIYNREDALADTATGSLQALAAIPTVPEWLTPVGQAYRFVATRPMPRTIGFNYLQREVPPGYEHTLQLYYSPDEGATWDRLPTELDTDENLATAPADNSGLYMLASSIDIPFYTAGWNLFAYPVPETRPAEQALASIAGHYSTVFAYDNRDSADPWKVFDASAEDWVNDLKSLEYGSGYWVNISTPITLQIKVASDAGGERPTLSMGSPNFSDALGRRNPPAVYYGTVQGSVGQPLAPGQVITAEIDDQQCGAGTVEPVGAEEDPQRLQYVVKVVATELGAVRSCGMPGKEVNFKLGATALYPAIEWDNRRPTEHALRTQP